jgi:hypothetical protein
MNTIRVGLLLILVLGFSSAQSLDEKKIESYRLAVENMINIVKQDSLELTRFLISAQEALDTKAQAMAKSAAYVKQRSDEFNAISEGINLKNNELDKQIEQFRNKHEAIDRMHEKFSIEYIEKIRSHPNTVEKNNRLYLSSSVVFHDDISVAFAKGVVGKIGNPNQWDSNSYKTRLWNKRYLLKFGRNRCEYKNGMTITVPEGSEVLWLRCADQHWGNFYVTYEESGARKDLGSYTCGYRNLNEISPDGGAPDSYRNSNMWFPIPVKKSGAHIVHSNTHSDSWISGIAYSKNLWGHARQSAVGLHWAVNGGTKLGWNSHNWNNDQLATIDVGKKSTLKVPVVANGKDKLFYIVEHNNNWVGTVHNTITVEGKNIERLRTSYNNPFAVHFNSKSYSRYIASFVPKELIPAGATFISVEIDMVGIDKHIYFREAGTHDY